MKNNSQRGSVLLAVVLALSLIAAVALLLNRGGGMNLESSAGQEMADVARATAEAGLNLTAWQASQSSCEDYESFTDEPFGSTGYQNVFASVYTTSVTPDNGSPVLVKAKGVLQNSGTEQEISRLVTVYDLEITETLQPDAADGKDTYVNEQSKRNNYGVSTQLGVDSGGAHDYFALLEFDVPNPPPGAEIRSATLELYLESIGSTNQNAKFTLYRMTQAWAEGTGDGSQSGDGATKNTSDGTTPWDWSDNYNEDNLMAVTIVNPSFSGWHSWEIKPLVEGWQAGHFPNQGMLIIGNNQARDAFFAASDHADPALRPKLTIIYACECGGEIQTLVLQPGSGPGKDTMISSFKPHWNYGASESVDIDNGWNQHFLSWFDLSSIQAEMQIHSATLDLNVNQLWYGGGDFSAHRLIAPWTEGTCTEAPCATGATWNTTNGTTAWAAAGGDYAPEILDTEFVASLGWHSWDITPAVQGWQSGALANYGILLDPQVNGAISVYTSDYGVDPSLHPKLTVTYSCPCGIDCVAGSGGGACGDFTPTGIVSEFSTTGLGSGKTNGLAYLPEGTTFRGVAAPAGGAWLIIDKSRNLDMTDMAGNLLSNCILTGLDPATSEAITLVQSGIWAGHLAVSAMETNDKVAFVDLDCNVISSFPTLPFGSYTPTGLGFIGTTASTTYEEHLAVADYFSDAVYIVDQTGSLKATLDLSAFIGQVHGVSHLPGTDKLLLMDKEMGHAFIIDFVNFSGTPLVDYDAAPFGTGAPTAAAINPLTCDHMLGDETADKVVALNIGGPSNPSVTLNPVADNRLDENSTSNNGEIDNIKAGLTNSNENRYSVLLFDVSEGVSGIPTNSTVNSATLRLFATAREGNKNFNIGVHRVNEDWTEMGSNWASSDGATPWIGGPGGSFDALPADSVIAASTGWYEWDLTPLVQEWVDLFSVNNGIELVNTVPPQKKNVVEFSSREGANRPELVIEYTAP